VELKKGFLKALQIIILIVILKCPTQSCQLPVRFAEKVAYSLIELIFINYRGRVARIGKNP